jgi:hypothetical protein
MEPAKFENSLHNRLGHVMFPSHPENMAPFGFDQMSHKDTSLSLARTSSANWNYYTDTHQMKSERPRKWKTLADYINQKNNDSGYTSSFTSAQSQSAAALMGQEIAASNKDCNSTINLLQKDPRISVISETTVPVVEGEDLNPLLVLADLAANQEYVGIWTHPKDLQIPLTVAITPKTSSRALQPPPTLMSLESKDTEGIATKEQQLPALLSPSLSETPESKDSKKNQLRERQIPTPPRSQTGTSGSRDSGDDKSQVGQECIMGKTQTTQGDNNNGAGKVVLTIPRIELKYPLEPDHEVNKASWILLDLKHGRETEVDLTQDGSNAPSVSRSVHQRVRGSAGYTSGNNPPVREMSAEQFNTFLDNHHNESESDSDTTIVDPRWV